MELWHTGADLRQVFSAEDIPNILIQVVNNLVMCKHNKASTEVVKNFMVSKFCKYGAQIILFFICMLLLIVLFFCRLMVNQQSSEQK